MAFSENYDCFLCIFFCFSLRHVTDVIRLKLARARVLVFTHIYAHAHILYLQTHIHTFFLTLSVWSIYPEKKVTQQRQFYEWYENTTSKNIQFVCEQCCELLIFFAVVHLAFSHVRSDSFFRFSMMWILINGGIAHKLYGRSKGCV